VPFPSDQRCRREQSCAVMIRYDAAKYLPLATDEQVAARVVDLIGVASSRQLWLLFLDDENVQLPVLLPSDVDSRPHRRARESFLSFVSEIVDATACAAVIPVFERPGTDVVSQDDREWIELVSAAVHNAGVVLRGPLLSHSEGVRWIGPDDYV
jgi:hypothetical protein